MKCSPTSFASPKDKTKLVKRVFRRRHFNFFFQKRKKLFLFQQAAIFSPLAHTRLSLKSKKSIEFFGHFFLFPLGFLKHRFCLESMTLELKIDLVGKNVLQQFEKSI